MDTRTFGQDEALRRRMKEAFAGARAHPALRPRVVAALADAPRAPGRAVQPALAAAAVVLVLAIAAVVLLGRAGSRGAPPPAPLPAASGSPAGGLQVATGLDFSCALPVLLGGRPATIHLPDGAITAYGPAAGPAPPAAAFVRGRWVPADAADVAPDGRSFAYAEYTSGVPGQADSGRVLVRDEATGRDRQVWEGQGHAEVAGWTAAGIVILVQPDGEGLGVTEVRLVDPAHPGPGRRLGPNPPYGADTPPGQLPLFLGTHLLAGGALWTTFDNRPTGVGHGANHVARMDLATGRVTTWLTTPAGQVVRILGLDGQGRPVLDLEQETDGQTATPPGSLALLTGPDQVAVIAGAGLGQQWLDAAGDGHGTWIATQDSLWLSRGGGLVRVGTVPAGALGPGGSQLRVVGGCR